MLNDILDTVSDSAAEEFMDRMARLLTKASRIEQEPVDTGDGTLLFTSEIHLLDMAGRFPAESMSAIAARLGITRGAVSQTAKKLEEKGYLRRYNRDGDNKTTCLALTGAGERAFAWHRAYHEQVNGRIVRVFQELRSEDQKNLQRTLGALETVFDDCPEIRRSLGKKTG
jgi:DNA-binding MarR family transcriptional regulator